MVYEGSVLLSEELKDGFADLVPFLVSHSDDAPQTPLVSRNRPTVPPVRHQKVQIRPRFRHRQMRGIGDVVRNVERHPCVGFGHRKILPDQGKTGLRPPRVLWGYLGL